MWNIYPTRGEFILLAQYLSLLEASIVAGRLETEGISVLLRDEHVVWNNQLQSQAVGGVKLLVNYQEKEIARRVLDNIGRGEYCPAEAWDAVRNRHAVGHRWVGWLLSALMVIFLFILPVITLLRQIAE
ncbi:TPA: hypothetical protein P5S08_004228 [Salmonella enterica subsp. enterica serovar Concord]|nr:hypothetical protein [Salmonella enterica subsp. enterica serovar Concord]